MAETERLEEGSRHGLASLPAFPPSGRLLSRPTYAPKYAPLLKPSVGPQSPVSEPPPQRANERHAERAFAQL